MSNSFWGRPSTPNIWSSANNQFNRTGLRPLTAPNPTKKTTSSTISSTAITQSTQLRPTTTESERGTSLPPHLPFYSQQYHHHHHHHHHQHHQRHQQHQHQRGYSRERETETETDTAQYTHHVSMPSLMDLVDPIEPGKQRSAGGRVRGRRRKKGKKTRQRHKLRSPSLEHRRSKRKKKTKRKTNIKSKTTSKKTKQPSTAPAGRKSLIKPLVTTPVEGILPILMGRPPTVDNSNNNSNNNNTRSLSLETKHNTTLEEIDNEEERSHYTTPREDRGQQPCPHIMNSSYVRGRDGHYLSCHPSHTIGTFNPHVSLKEWNATDDSLYMLADNNASRSGTYIKTLDLSGCFSITEHGLSALLHHATDLQELNLSMCGKHLSDKILFLIASVCTNLSKLNVSSCKGFTDSGFSAIAGWMGEMDRTQFQAKHLVTEGGWDWNEASEKTVGLKEKKVEPHVAKSTPCATSGLTKLKQLSMANCPLLSDLFLSRLSMGCPELRTLDVSNCPLITDDGLRKIVDRLKHLRELLMNENVKVSGRLFFVSAKSHKDCDLYVCTGLRNVSMQGCYKLDDTKLMWLGQSCALLESIDVSNCPQISSRGVKHLCEKCPRLVSLTVIGCGTLDDSVGRAITTHLASNIISLDVAGASDLSASSLAPLISQCRHVRHLNFSGLPKLSDEVFTGEAEIDRNMEVLRQDPRYADSARKKVRSVYISDSKLLTKKGFSAIAWLFRHALVMDFSGCLHFGNTALYHVTEHCRAIKELNLNDCVAITDIGVRRISSRCQKLEILRLSVKSTHDNGCTNVGDKSLSALLRRLRLLRILELQNRILITGKTIPMGPAFRAKMIRNIDFSGCTELHLDTVRTILAECPFLTHMNLTKCQCVTGKSRMNSFKSFVHLLPYPELIEIVHSPTFRGLKGVPNYAIKRNQIYFLNRIALEHRSAATLQTRWRGYKNGDFTLMYLILWTSILRKKGKVEDCAIILQKYYRRKIGIRLAWERKQVVSAEIIQRCLRAYNAYKQNFAAHLRVYSCKRIQQWWRTLMYMKISLRDRIWECVQNQKKLEEIERRKHEKKYFGARSIQCWYRRIRAVRHLTVLQSQRQKAIYGSALIVPRKIWRRSKVHAPKHAQFVDRTVVQFGEADEQVGQKTATANRPSTAPVGNALQPDFIPKVKGNVLSKDVQQIRRYPGRYCQRCTNRHAVVHCTVCLLELCPRCNVELHVVDKYGKSAKFMHHPTAKAIRQQMPKDIRFVKSIQIAESAWGDTEWLLRPIMRVREQRLVMHEELIVEIERKKEIRQAEKIKQEQRQQLHLETCVSICNAHWRGFLARRNLPIVKKTFIVEKETRKKRNIFTNAVKIQALLRGYSIRIWVLKLRMDDPYLFWRDVHRRIIHYLPGVTKHQWKIADKLLEEDFVEIITGKNRDFKARFGAKVRRYEHDIRALATKIQNLQGDSSDYLKRWHALLNVGKVTPLSHVMKGEAKKLESEGRRLEAQAQGFGAIMALMKQRLVFVTGRKAYEDRRDAVLRAQKKAFDMAKVNILKILKATHDTVEAIELMQNLPQDDFDAMNVKAEAILEKAEALERKNQPLPPTELTPRMPDEEYNELTEEEQHEYETSRILQEQEIKQRIENQKKKKEKRTKDRLKLWKAQWSKRNAWLRKEHKHVLHKTMRAENTVLSMARALVETRSEEIRLYKEYDTIQSIVEQSIQAEIHYEAEIMQLECKKQMLEAMQGKGAKGILEAVRNQVHLREKQHRLHDTYGTRVLDCVKDSDTQTERRERFIVADWSDSRNRWAVYARPKRFELQFSSDSWSMNPSDWLNDYKQKPWVDYMKSGKEESGALKEMNKRFGSALSEAQKEIKDKEDKEAQEKAVEDAKNAATAAIVAKQKADIQTITKSYGNVLSNLLTDVSPELTAAREKERRIKMSRMDRFKEDAYNLIMGPTIRKRTEMRRVQESIEQRQKASVGYIEAICAFHITTGGETAKFEVEQKQNKMDNKPYYTKIPENLGREWSVFLWIMKTIDSETMVTAMVLSSAVKYNKLCYVDPDKLLKDGYFRSNEIPTEGHDSAQLVVWSRSDASEKLVLHDVAVSFTDRSEKFLREDGYVRLDPDLGDLRMPPDGRIWCKYGSREREKLSKAQDEAFYNEKIAGYQQVLKEEPNNPVVKKKIKRLQEDLRQFKLNEESKKKNKLRNMVEFLALSEKDMRKFSLVFTDIDLDNSGEIDLTEFFDYLEIDRTVFTDSLFEFLDESNDGTINFAEFVHACGTICMWETKQILQFMFSMYDTAGNGYIIESQLEALLSAVGGDDPINTGGIGRVMSKFDKDGDGRVDWEEFQAAAGRFPSAFIPAFRILDQWRKKIMGNKFWKRKKRLFMKVRENMAQQRKEAAEEAKKVAMQKRIAQAAAKKQADNDASNKGSPGGKK